MIIPLQLLYMSITTLIIFNCKLNKINLYYVYSSAPNTTVIWLLTLLQVRYLSDSTESFNSDNLEVSIQLSGTVVTWKPTPAVQDSLEGNLKGTIRVRTSCNYSRHAVYHRTAFN